jgi:hypothetical protein
MNAQVTAGSCCRDVRVHTGTGALAGHGEPWAAVSWLDDRPAP